MSRFQHGHGYPVALAVNHAPTNITMAGTPDITENASPGTVIGSFTTTDQDAGDSATYTLTDTMGGRFAISGNQLVTGLTNIDYESLTTPQYDLQVTATDALGATFAKTFTIFVLDGPEAPYNILLSNLHLPETTATLTNIVSIAGFDPDTGDSLTFSITADPDNKFQISGGNWLQLKNPLNYEAKASHSLTLRATDSTGLVFDKTFVFDVLDVNEAPISLSLSNTNVAGGAGDGTFIGTLSATDPDASQTFSYSVVADADAKFQVVNSNELRLRATVDSTVKAAHDVTIRVTDQGGQFFEQTFTINVGVTRHAPSNITLSNTVVSEDAATGSLVGNLTTTDADAGDTFTYSIVTDSNGMFNISGATLVTKNQPQWKTSLHPSGVSVTVRTTDSDGFFFDKTFAITISAVNHAPTGINTSPSSLIVLENVGVGSTICTLSAVDSDAGDTATFTKTADPDSKFTLVGNALKLAAALDYSVKTAHTCDILLTDSGGLTFARTLTITVGQVYFAPSDISLTNNTVAENVGGGTVIGNLAVVDTDNSTDPLSISSDPDSKFQIINGNQLAVAASATFDWSVKTSHSVTVLATDPVRGSFAKTFTINVSRVYFAPTDITLSTNAVAEDTAIGVAIANITVTDPDGSVDTLSITTDADSKFQIINSNQLALLNTLNYATKTSHSVTLKATDPVRGNFSKTFTINVTHVNHAPTDIALSGTHAVAENSGAGTTVGTLSSTDPDAGDTFTYSITTDNNAMFQLSGSILQTRNPANWNYEARTSTAVVIRATDAGGLFVEKSFTINLTDVNEAPVNLVSTPSPITVPENATVGTLVCTVGATDPDSGDTLTYTITSDPSSKFTLTNGNEIHLAATVDYSVATSHTLGVTATDSGGLTVVASFTVNVGQVWFTPSDITLSSTSIAENNAVNALVGTLSPVDANTGETGHTYSIITDADGVFTISNTNELHASASFNYEAKASHSVTIRCTDPVRGHVDKTFVIAVTNVNEAPTAVLLDNLTVANNAATGTLVGNLSTSDPDAGDTFTYAITAGNSAGNFQIVGATLKTAVANVATGTYTLTIRTTDAGGLSFSTSFDIVSQVQYEAEATALFAAMTVQPTTTRKGLINDCILSLKSNGIWATLDLLYMCAAHDQQASQLNWKNPGTNTLTLIGSPVFTTDQGWVGVGTTSKLNTGFNPTTATGRKVSQNNCATQAYIKSNSTTALRTVGNVGLGVTQRGTGGKVSIEVGGGTTGATYNGSATNFQGFAQGRRLDAANQSGWENLGATGATQAVASVALANTTMDVGGGGSSSTTNASPHQTRMFAIGSGLDDTGISNSYSAINTFLVAIGANLTTGIS